MAEDIEALRRDRDRWKAGNEGLVAANAVLLKQLEYARKTEARLRAVLDRYTRHDELCHTLDRHSLATHERICTCGLEDALTAVNGGSNQ